jgi:NSS family neurotransmitter:Na+ symporter
MLIALFVGWVLPKSTVVGQLGFDGGRYALWQVLSRFVAPAGVLVVFVYTVISTV